MEERYTSRGFSITVPQKWHAYMAQGYTNAPGAATRPAIRATRAVRRRFALLLRRLLLRLLALACGSR